MVTEEIRAEVRRLIADVTERKPEEISDTALLTDELGLDSLMALEVMVAVDKKYKINIPEEEFSTIRTLNDAVEVVRRHLLAAPDEGAASAGR
ncbi:MAG: polyketide-8 synthase acyl carrier protein [Acidobacteria bacterium]|nr:MAG: polyketide-8 synthase acyl carrier protein [Acidobacteriota bacterium]